jgi:thymidine phosphorylase
LKAMERIQAAQGPPPRVSALGARVKEATAARDGFVTGIDCFRIARIARLAGAPTDPGAGLDLLKRLGDPVRQGEPLYRLHAEDPADFAMAAEALEEAHGFSISLDEAP